MELLCPGLLYMFISRAATIGTPSNRKDSAFFFCSNKMNEDSSNKMKEDRFTNLTITLIDWVNTTTIDIAAVNSIINDKH